MCVLSRRCCRRINCGDGKEGASFAGTFPETVSRIAKRNEAIDAVPLKDVFHVGRIRARCLVHIRMGG